MHLKSFANKLVDKFIEDDTMTLAASLAFYTALSLAPILILFLTFSAGISDGLQERMIAQVHELVGDDAATVIEMIVSGAKNRSDLKSIGGLTGLLTLLISASLIFGQLRSALNRVFAVPGEAKMRPSKRILEYFKERLLQAFLALCFVFFLITSLLLSSMISANVHSEHLLMLVLSNILISLTFYCALFTLVFRFMPDLHRPWISSLEAGLLTAFLFVVGKEVIGFYIGKSAIGSSYGAAGSVIVLFVWVYYSSVITFVGAQVSYVLQSNRAIV